MKEEIARILSMIDAIIIVSKENLVQALISEGKTYGEIKDILFRE